LSPRFKQTGGLPPNSMSTKGHLALTLWARSAGTHPIGYVEIGGRRISRARWRKSVANGSGACVSDSAISFTGATCSTQPGVL